MLRKRKWYRRVMTWLDNQFYRFTTLKPFYWVRSVVIEKHHLIDLRGALDYKWGYTDPSHKLFIAPFVILCEFIEKEHPFDIIDWDSDPDHRHAADEMQAIYAWFKTGRAEQHAKVEAMYVGYQKDEILKFGDNIFDSMNQPGWGKFYREHPVRIAWAKAEEELEAIDEDMLQRVMKIRRYLWT